MLSGTLPTQPAGTTVRAYLCQPGMTVDTGNPAGPPPFRCAVADTAGDKDEKWWETTTAGTDRAWSFSGLREGYYLVRYVGAGGTNPVVGLGLISNPNLAVGLRW